MARASHLDNNSVDSLSRAKATAVRARLLRWFTRKGRDFLWRRETSPYVVLVSEVLLKKTTAPVVDRFLPNFLQNFPNVESLSKVPVRNLRRILQPLGLSSQRADQLRSLASAIVANYEGNIPTSRHGLLDLPGVGPYTANSVLCVAFDKAAPIVDTNVARIVLRVFGIAATRYEPRRCPSVWALAEAIAGNRAPVARRTNWALLDLGAVHCLAKAPICRRCPLRACCSYASRANGVFFKFSK